MKKIISLILVLTILCCSFAVSFADDNISNEELEALEILRLFGIIPDYYDYNTSLSENVSRADFVNNAIKLMGELSYSGTNTYYYDVPQTHYAYDAIGMLTDMGILSGTGSSLFKPDDPIEAAAAYKILLAMLGYEEIAVNKGGYPIGYLTTAQEVNIASGNGGYLTRGDMLITLSRALTAEMLVQITYSENGMNRFEVSENDTMLSVYRDVYYKKGILYGAEMINIGAGALNEKNEVLIDGVIYECDFSLSDKIGEQIRFYAYINEKNDERKILWVKETGKTDVLYLTEEEISGFDKNTFTLSYYASGNKASKINLDRGITVIYNGREVTKNIDEVLSEGNYSIKLLSMENEYDTAIVKSYENIVADSIDSTNMVIYDKASPGNFVKLDESLYDYLVIKQAGSEITFAEIAAGFVLSVAVSKDERYAEVIVTNIKVSGTLSSAENTGDGVNVVIDGKKYYMPGKTLEDMPQIGLTVTLFTDRLGYGAYIETVTGSHYAAYVVRTVIEGSGLDNVLKIKLFTQDKEMKILSCAKSVVADGERIKNDPEEINKIFTENNEFKPQLVLIETDSEGKISKIDTSNVRKDAESEENTLSLSFASESLPWKWIGHLGQRAVLDDNTIIFEVPVNLQEAEDDDFRIRKKAELIHDSYYQSEGYRTTIRNDFEEYVVVTSTGSTDFDESLPVVFEGIVSMLDEEGNTVEGLSGKQGSVDVVLPSDGKLSFSSKNLTRGMLVRPFINNKNKVTSIEVLFEPSKIGTYNTPGQFNARYGVIVGYVNDVIGNIMKIGYTDPKVVDHTTSKYTAPVIVYDTQNTKKPVITGAFSDARTYYNSKENCSTVVMIIKWGEPRLFVIYN